MAPAGMLDLPPVAANTLSPTGIASNIAKSGPVIHKVVIGSTETIVALPFPDFASAPAMAGHKEKYEQRSTNVV